MSLKEITGDDDDDVNFQCILHFGDSTQQYVLPAIILKTAHWASIINTKLQQQYHNMMQ